MKKKTYFIPTTCVYRIKPQHMIASTNLTLDRYNANGVSNEGDVLSRRGHYDWDDDDYDE